MRLSVTVDPELLEEAKQLAKAKKTSERRLSWPFESLCSDGG